MYMSIEIGSVKLKKIHRIKTVEDGAYVHHKIPGMQGNVSQDLGRDSVRLQIDGIFYGKKAGDDLEELRKLYIDREEVEFLADITGQTYASNVKIDSLQVAQSAKLPNQYSYSLVISEYCEPESSTTDMGAIDALVDVEAKVLMDIMELPDALSLGQIPELSNPIEPLQGALEPLKGAVGGLLESTKSLKELL